MSLASWYTHQYSTWNRTRRLQQSQYLARTDTNTSRQARAMAQNGADVAVDNMHGLGVVGPLPKDSSKDKKGPDSLFGPNIGVISGGPAWTVSSEKKVLKDELTMDVVKSWIEKSKEPSQPTTTLQALVNLKRPTLRLSPLVSTEGDDTHSHQHGLEFEYDCDAPKCGIYVHVLLPPGHPDAPPSAPSPTTTASTLTPSKLLVFESVVDGGFGKVLKLEEGAVLELGRFDMSQRRTETSAAPAASTSNPDTSVPHATSTNSPETAPAANNPRHGRRRITHLFTKRHGHNNHNMSVSGPALAVVDASSDSNAANADTPGAPASANDKSKKDAVDEGVKVTIRLAALDEQGTELSSPNEQGTYLCVERFGAKPKPSTVTPPAPATAASSDAAAGASETKPEGQEQAKQAEPEEEEDTRPWVVKVVKREATIGPHTFHLHEIYGLTSSSSSSHTHAPTAPLPSSHTYPPTPGAAPSDQPENSEDTPSECLLCLSSPREVVLLPCRHLVACKDCALNMVEFGAGGNITQPAEEPSTTSDTTAATAEGGEGANAAAGATTPTPAATTTPTNPRRKRKAKGWFCPVCRQPYTSLLRITTTQPPLPVGKTETTAVNSAQDESEDEERDVTDADASASAGEGLPLPVTAEGAGAAQNTSAAAATNTTEANSNSGGGMFSRPGFLRGLTGRGNAQTGDLESQL